MNQPLKIISVSHSPSPNSEKGQKKDPLQELEADMERKWLLCKDKMTGENRARDLIRFERTMSLIHHLKLNKKARVLDVGCGAGIIARQVYAEGFDISVCDIASRALEEASKNLEPSVSKQKAALPRIPCEDHIYDLVLCTDVIAYLPEKDHRLALSELARIVKRDGIVVLSTPIDIYSDGASEKLIRMIQTEFEIIEWTPSYNRISIQCLNWLQAPTRFHRAYKDPEYLKEQLNKREGLSRKWFGLNSIPGLSHFWGLISLFTQPLAKFLEKSRSLTTSLEKVSQFFQDERGMSHIIFTLSIRPVFDPNTPSLPERAPFLKTTQWD